MLKLGSSCHLNLCLYMDQLFSSCFSRWTAELVFMSIFSATKLKCHIHYISNFLISIDHFINVFCEHKAFEYFIIPDPVKSALHYLSMSLRHVWHFLHSQFSYTNFNITFSLTKKKKEKNKQYLSNFQGFWSSVSYYINLGKVYLLCFQWLILTLIHIA